MNKKFLSEFIYGGMDGIITTVAIVSGVLGADISYRYAFILGISSLFADGFSMGISRYNSLSDINNDTNNSPFISGIATFLSFVILGFIPLIPFLFYDETNKNITHIIILFSILSFLIIGFIKGIYTKKLFKSLSETVIIGSTGSLISYYVASYFK